MDAPAAEEEAAARAAEHENRAGEKLRHSTLVMKDSKMLKERLRKGAFGCGDALNWALLVEDFVDFWFLNGLLIIL